MLNKNGRRANYAGNEIQYNVSSRKCIYIFILLLNKLNKLMLCQRNNFVNNFNYETFKMHANTVVVKYLVIYFFVTMCSCEGVRTRDKTKFKRKINSASDFRQSLSNSDVVGKTVKNEERGFGSIFTIPKVLNFFPVGGERECIPTGHNVARAGICVNPYDCRQRDGRSAGNCAHGLGVCCVFEVTCGGKVQNNLTYFMSPGFPGLWNGDKDCEITIEKTHAGIMQLRIDFEHFMIGQPNRTTGECNEDAMILEDGDSKFTLCGQNHGQHVYHSLSSGSEARDGDDLPSTKTIKLIMRMVSSEVPRLWLMRFAQMPLAHSAPHNCLQYFTENNGTIRTFNYASNGRHLAAQEYRSCVKRNPGMCSVRYSPCDERSFRIGPGVRNPGSGSVQQDQNMMPAMDNVQTQPDDIEGSGDDPQIQAASAAVESSMPAPPTNKSKYGIFSYIMPSWLWQRRGKTWNRWSPYTQHYSTLTDYKFPYHGYGNFGAGLHGRLRCHDRITIPCENEYFVSSNMQGAGVCDPHHCGSSFCPGYSHQECRIESSISPFAVSVHFGPPTPKDNPEDNIGACLRYYQMPCQSNT